MSWNRFLFSCKFLLGLLYSLLVQWGRVCHFQHHLSVHFSPVDIERRGRTPSCMPETLFIFRAAILPPSGEFLSNDYLEHVSFCSVPRSCSLLFPDLSLFQVRSTGPAHSLWVSYSTRAGRASPGTLSNPSAVSRDESFMSAGFPSSSWDAGLSCKVDLLKIHTCFGLVSYIKSCIVCFLSECKRVDTLSLNGHVRCWILCMKSMDVVDCRLKRLAPVNCDLPLAQMHWWPCTWNHGHYFGIWL